MPLIRLIGLALLITVILLTLAAAITKTSHIHIQLPISVSGAAQNSGPPTSATDGNGVMPPLADNNLLPSTDAAMQFTSVPIIWPLLIAAGAGLLMWFLHPPEPLRKQSTSIRKSKRRN